MPVCNNILAHLANLPEQEEVTTRLVSGFRRAVAAQLRSEEEEFNMWTNPENPNYVQWGVCDETISDRVARKGKLLFYSVLTFL